MFTQAENIANSIYLEVVHDVTPMNFIEFVTLVKEGKIAKNTIFKVFLANTEEDDDDKEYLFYYNGFDFSYAHYNKENDKLTVATYEQLEVNTNFISGEYTPVGIWLN